VLKKLIKTLKDKEWITYSKQPFGGPEHVLEYLGRYTHRVAVKAEEFIRCFLLHVLPSGFMKIRNYGFLAHANKKVSIHLLRQLINPDAVIEEELTETVEEMMLRLTGVYLSLCPECG